MGIKELLLDAKEEALLLLEGVYYGVEELGVRFLYGINKVYHKRNGRSLFVNGDVQILMVKDYLKEFIDPDSADLDYLSYSFVHSFHHDATLDTLLATNMFVVDDGKNVLITNKGSEHMLGELYVYNLPGGMDGKITVSSPDGHFLEIDYDKKPYCYVLMNTIDDNPNMWHSVIVNDWRGPSQFLRREKTGPIEGVLYESIIEFLKRSEPRDKVPVKIGELGYVEARPLTSDHVQLCTDLYLDTRTGERLPYVWDRIHTWGSYSDYSEEEGVMYFLDRFLGGVDNYKYAIHTVEFSNDESGAKPCKYFITDSTPELEGLWDDLKETSDGETFKQIYDIVVNDQSKVL